jgi:glycosyltransferase involved in cell wall biosynthesis
VSTVLWLGDAGCTTGFATVSHAIGDRLVDTYGHDVHTLATNYRGDPWPSSMKLYVPTMRDSADTYGTSRMVEMLGKIGPEVVISLNDPLVILRHLFKNRHDKELLLARYAPILAYMPVDGANYPAITTKVAELVKSLEPLPGRAAPFLLPVAMSKYGNTAFPDAPLVYHGVDTDTFQPVADKPVTASDGSVIRSKADAKRLLQVPDDCTLAVRVDRNSLRKNFADTISAMAPAMRRNPDLYLWLHCRADDPAGVDLNLFVSRFPDLEDRIKWPGMYDNSQGWPVENLIAVYAAADFAISTSGGEGFGLTLAEALAMKVPVIAMNVSAITEVVGPGGILLEPERTYVPLSGQDNWLPNVDAFTDAIEQLVKSRGKRRTLGEAGRKHVVDNFSWDEAARRFHELITGVVQKTSGAPAPAGGTP